MGDLQLNPISDQDIVDSMVIFTVEYSGELSGGDTFRTVIEDKNVINVEVVAKEGEDAEKLIRRFMKKVKKRGVLEEYRNSLVYQKPSAYRHQADIRKKRMNERNNELEKQKKKD